MGEDREIVLDYNAACPYYRRNLPVMVTSRAIWVMSDKDDKKSLVEQIATATGASVAGVIGHVAILYREHPSPEKRKVKLTAT